MGTEQILLESRLHFSFDVPALLNKAAVITTGEGTSRLEPWCVLSLSESQTDTVKKCASRWYITEDIIHVQNQPFPWSQLLVNLFIKTCKIWFSLILKATVMMSSTKSKLYWIND